MKTKHYSKGKSQIHKVPLELLEGVAEVLEYGSQKYEDYNWTHGTNWSEFTGSAARHLWKWFWLEDNDTESGLHHLKHVACNIAFLLYYVKNNKGTDDRPKR